MDVGLVCMTKSKAEARDVSGEILIKSKKRVRKHGEVFTPSHIVKKMLDLPTIKEACQDLTKTFFEPGAGEGAFLVEILKRKLSMVEREYSDTLARYENYSLLALSTLYGIALLPDNTSFCAMAVYDAYRGAYQRQLNRHKKNAKPSVINSAHLIISRNIIQGDFLTKLTDGNKPVVFSEWCPLNLEKNPIILKVQRTEYTLAEIEQGITKRPGETVDPKEKKGQMDLFFVDDASQSGATQPRMRYVPCNITSVHREEQEEENG